MKSEPNNLVKKTSEEPENPSQSRDGLSRRNIIAALAGTAGAGIVASACEGTQWSGDPALTEHSLSELVRGPGIVHVDNMSDLKSESASTYSIAIVAGYWLVGDGGGGVFYGEITGTPDAEIPGMYVHGPSEGGSDITVWHRCYSGDLNVRWFGVRSDFLYATENTTAFQAAIDCAKARNESLYVPSGDYAIEELAPIDSGSFHLFGDGPTSHIRASASSPFEKLLFFLGSETSKLEDIHVENLTLDGNDLVKSCLRFNHCIGVKTKSLTILNPQDTSGSAAMSGMYVDDWKIENITVRGVKKWGIVPTYSTNVIASYIDIEGDGPDSNSGFQFKMCAESSLTHANITGMKEHGVNIRSAYDYNVLNISVSNITLNDIGKDGIVAHIDLKVSDGTSGTLSGLTISNVVARDVGWSGVNLRSSDPANYLENVTVTDIICESSATTGSDRNYAGVKARRVTGLTLTNIIVREVREYCLLLNATNGVSGSSLTFIDGQLEGRGTTSAPYAFVFCGSDSDSTSETSSNVHLDTISIWGPGSEPTSPVEIESGSSPLNISITAMITGFTDDGVRTFTDP